jgi:hypothetical protein
MNILVMTALVPFAGGLSARIGAGLVGGLQAAGHRAELMRAPADTRTSERLVDTMLIWRSLRLSHIDRVIALGFPACLVAYPAKSVWMDDGGVPALAGPAERAGLAEACPVFAVSAAAAARLRAAHAIDVPVLAPPVADWAHAVAALLA